MKITESMRSSAIFTGLNDREILGMLPCLSAQEQSYEKNQIIYEPGDTIRSNSCEFHSKMIRNMVFVLAEKNYKLTQKMDHLTQKTTREKLLSYFSEQALETGKSSFEIPLDRQQLADYLSVDRSAMSTELGKMQREGMIEYRKNHFTLMEV